MTQRPEIAEIENEVFAASQRQIALLPRYSVHPPSDWILLDAQNIAVRRNARAISDYERIVRAIGRLLCNQCIRRGNELLGNPVHARWRCSKELAVKRYRLVHAAPVLKVLLPARASACLARNPTGRSDCRPAALAGRSTAPAQNFAPRCYRHCAEHD